MKKEKVTFAVMISVALFFVILFIFVSPQEVVSQIGVENTYILAFFVSLFGGLSAGGSASFISLIISLVIGGLDPLYLGIVSGIGITLGDIFLFTAFSKGRHLVKKSWDKKIKTFAKKIEDNKFYSFITPFLAYVYVGLSPFPNDILLAFLATIDYSKAKTYTIIFLGDITFTLLLAYSTLYSIPFFA